MRAYDYKTSSDLDVAAMLQSSLCPLNESYSFLATTQAVLVRGCENLKCALILLSEFKALKVLVFPELALKSLEFVNVNLSSSFVCVITASMMCQNV